MCEIKTIYEYFEKELMNSDVDGSDEFEIHCDQFYGVDLPHRMECPSLIVGIKKVDEGIDASCSLCFQYWEEVNPYIEQAEMIIERFNDYMKINGKELRFRFTIEGNKRLSYMIRACFEEEWRVQSMTRAMHVLVNQLLTMFVLVD